MKKAGIAATVTAVLLVAACAGGPSPAPATAQAAAPVSPSAAAPAPASSAAPASAPPAGGSGGDALATGKLLFEKTAGGVGCAYCHGLDGKGRGEAGVGAAYIRGASEARVRSAVSGGVPMMSFIKLSDGEITAVAAYLKRLGEQPG